MFDALTDWLLSTAQHIPLEAFTFFGSFIEELIAPIPSPIVMTVTGSIAAAQERALLTLLWLSFIGALGKTIGAVLVYWIADKAEDVFVGKFGHLFGISRADMDALSARLTGHSRDLLILTFLRALPIMSSAVVSVCSGVLRVRMSLYIISTFVGTVIRDFFYLYVGYTGIETLSRLVHGFDSVESLIQSLIGLFIVLAFAFVVWKRKVRKAPVSPTAPGTVEREVEQGAV